MSKAVSKGHIIDSAFGTGELVESNGLVYACTLNQTDIDSNKNKFYIMQLIKNGSNYILGIRYGRTGENGKAYTDPCASEDSGIATFQKQFRTKTGNVWGTKTFVKKPGKYFMSEVSYEDVLQNIPSGPSTIPDSKLDKRVQELIQKLSDVNMMKNALVSLEIDTKKLPLGKIRQSQLDKANEILIEIEKIINVDDNNGKVAIDKNSLILLSNQFYTLLPMSFSRRKPPIINSNEMIQKYRNMLNELSNIAITVKIQENVKSDENPLDSIYNSMNTIIKPVDKNSQTWLLIDSYIKTTHGPTHNPELELIELFEIEQNNKKELFDKYCKNIDNRQLLYHGTGMPNIISIFKNGFYLDPTKLNSSIPIAGKMFGMGVYHSSCSTKSFNYCNSAASNNIGTLILSEVALGKQYERINAENVTQEILNKKKLDSTKGVGQYESLDANVVTLDNVKIPMGPLKLINKNNTLYYNEYIVYDVDQFLMKYLVIVKNIGGKSNY